MGRYVQTLRPPTSVLAERMKQTYDLMHVMYSDSSESNFPDDIVANTDEKLRSLQST